MRRKENEEKVRQVIIKIKTPRDQGERPKITSNGLPNLVLLMAENNPVALYALLVILLNEQFGGIKTILKMDHMNIRGNQIAFAFQNFCGCDIEKFVNRIITQNFVMLCAININSAKRGEKEMAVLRNCDFVKKTPKMNDSLMEFLKKQKSLKDDDQLFFSI